MLESLVQLLFGHRPVLFSQGELQFAAGVGSYVAAAAGVAALAMAVAAYRTAPRLGWRDRWILLGIRATLLSLLVLALFRPVLVVRAAVPQQNFVGVLLDDSRSMQIADFGEGTPRSGFVTDQFGAADRGILGRLGEKFVVRTFGFASTAARVNEERPLTFSGSQTRLGPSLDAARQELAGLPLAGLVVVSDGADTGGTALDPTLLRLRADGIPVFTVGVGQERASRDIQVGRVATPRTALKGTSLMVDVVVSHSGYAGETVTVDVEDDGRIIGSQQVRLPADGSPATARVRVQADDAGPRVFRFRVAPRPDELVAENNAREALVDVRDRQEKILYFEGEPRSEFKFIRRALDEDRNVRVVALQRTADNKFLRLGVDGPDDLVAGFPKTRDELFAYRGLILGSVEAAAFTGDQLRMIAEFVDRRGGGLLVLGGPRSFGEGGWAGTAVADVLPFVLERGPSEPALERLTVRPTRAGALQALTQIAATEADSAERWSTMPGLTAVNRVDTVKPGATVLLTGAREDRGERPVLAFQRYGRGHVYAFAAQDSWLWQMHASVAVDDLTHEYFWRQLLRGLVEGVPDPVELTTMRDRVEPGERVSLGVSVADAGFVEVNDATVVAQVTGPDGAVTAVPLQWSGEASGQYGGAFPTGAPGWYEVRIDATRGERTLGSSVAHVRATAGDAEYFDATMQATALRRLAEETGGRFYTPDTVSGLPEDMNYTGRGVTTVEERELWHMPILLVLLVGLACAEWAYRRKAGLT
ncbi:MAG: glutamine amidotransferase [Acidobacteriota bacterium]